MGNKLAAVTPIDVVHRHDFPRMLRMVAEQIESGEVAATDCVVVVRDVTASNEDGVDTEEMTYEVWARGDLAKHVDGVHGILTHAQLHLFRLGLDLGDG